MIFDESSFENCSESDNSSSLLASQEFSDNRIFLIKSKDEWLWILHCKYDIWTDISKTIYW